jgi:two-component sensor histidine kinase
VTDFAGSAYSADLDGKNKHNFLSSRGNLTELMQKCRSAFRDLRQESQRRVLAVFDTILSQNEDIRSPSPATDDQADNVGLFLRETHHRMKNTLTLLGAWVRADFRSTASVDLPTAIDGFERRILAFGRLYDLLSNGSDRRYTSIGEYVGFLSRALTVAVLEPKGIRCEVTIGHGFLETKRCERLGLIIAELVTNAAKHAFPNQQSGLICIEAFYRDGFWRCTVKDSGVGTCGTRRGVGGRIVEDLAQSIGGYVVTESCSGGTAVTVVVPHHTQSIVTTKGSR